MLDADGIDGRGCSGPWEKRRRHACPDLPGLWEDEPVDEKPDVEWETAKQKRLFLLGETGLLEKGAQVQNSIRGWQSGGRWSAEAEEAHCASAKPAFVVHFI